MKIYKDIQNISYKILDSNQTIQNVSIHTCEIQQSSLKT